MCSHRDQLTDEAWNAQPQIVNEAKHLVSHVIVIGSILDLNPSSLYCKPW